MLSGYSGRPGGAPEPVRWSARARLARDGGALAFVRDQTLAIGAPISFTISGDTALSALDALLAAAGGEIVTGFARHSERRGLVLDSCEVVVLASLENPLVAASVVGEQGSAAIAALDITVYAASPEPQGVLHDALHDILDSLPVYSTLARGCAITLTFKLML
jgi:hypothetical protein